MIIIIIQENFTGPLYKDGVLLSQDCIDNTRRQFTFHHKSPQEFLVIIWSTSENWKTESTLEPPSVLQL